MVQRVKAVVRGAVQGVGFRPFVYRLASELRINGQVRNSPIGVCIEAEGELGLLQQFLHRLEEEKPPRAILKRLEFRIVEPVGYERFEICHSDPEGERTAFVLPDIATCADCLREMFDPNDRRYLYPFTNCTNCGPRFSIIEGLPYDRGNTSMRGFALCPDCQREYCDPNNRRFHAEPIACHSCGPHLELWSGSGATLSMAQEALLAAAEIVRNGNILALKGLGGFQLICDAANERSVSLLRERKRREEKPFALMYPSLERVRTDCLVSEFEAGLLLAPEAPIVLLAKRPSPEAEAHQPLTPIIAPNNPCLGVMLPYTPVHHLLLRELGFPIVATSGNLSDEPICTEEDEALVRLQGIADLFLVHNRPIVRHIDDSVVRMMMGRELMLRRARGYAPLPIQVKHDLPAILGLGAQLKNAIALGFHNQVYLSQHIGDLENKESYDAFQEAVVDLPRLYGVSPEFMARDLHPDYTSRNIHCNWPLQDQDPTGLANGKSGEPSLTVQHHYAHLLACMAENELEPPVLGIIWDGTGLGLDGTIWGGEFLVANESSFSRVAHLRSFMLPGGGAAIKQPRRCALGLLYEIFGQRLFEPKGPLPTMAFSETELSVLRNMLRRKLNSPRTSSAGRLFDAVASLVGLLQRASFEGQAAMELEFSICPSIQQAYSFDINGQSPWILDWEEMIKEILAGIRRAEGIGEIAARFHNTLVEMAVDIARKVSEPTVVLSGGCFQNKYLTERLITRLREAGFRPYWHQRVPPNDGSIALGQVLAATGLVGRRETKPGESKLTAVSSGERQPVAVLAHAQFMAQGRGEDI